MGWITGCIEAEQSNGPSSCLDSITEAVMRQDLCRHFLLDTMHAQETKDTFLESHHNIAFIQYNTIQYNTITTQYDMIQWCFVLCEKFMQYLPAFTQAPWPPKRTTWRCIGSFAHFTDSGRFYMGVCAAFVIVARPQTPAPVPLCLPVCGRALFCMATRKPHFIGTL